MHAFGEFMHSFKSVMQVFKAVMHRLYYNIINKPKTITKNKYLEIEEKLIDLAKKTNLTLAELDLYLWYTETGKILK